MADWKESGCYFTYEASYVKNQLHQFINLYEKGLIFRDFKPVHWSPSSRTALAEAELEYNTNHKSKCATVRLLVNKVSPALKTVANQQIYALVWTTTPWSLIANQAVAYAADVKYCLAEDAKGNLNIIAEKLLDSIVENIGPLKPVISITGNELAGAKYLQPITNISLPFIPGSHVTTDKGTGLVHIAPAHGPEDFLLALENKIPVLSLVDEEGRYTSEAGPKFAGLEVLGQGTETILENLGQNLLHVKTLVHSYPYDWRTKKPVIIRASKQWFIDTGSIKQEALVNLQNLEIYPKHNAASWTNALRGQIERRPYWCISRQRAWGTPIPVLYRKSSKEIFMSRDLVERLCHLIVKYGPDCWWDFPVEKLMGKELLKKLQVDSSDFEKGQDIMDIWLDSGLSWSRVLPEGKADLYLEGMDQFTGWFQSSLLTSVALQGSSPYKALFVHGFAVDEKAHKMSKSVGNIVDPEEITKGGEDLQKNPAYGVSTLRWWVAAHGSQRSQVPVGKNILRESAESLQKIRLTLRFLLGALHPYITENSVEPQYLLLDKYMFHQLYHYDQKIKDLYDDYQYHHVCQSILNFVSNDISAEYCHLVKDRVYCDAVNSPYRAGAIDVIGEILVVLVRSLAPIVPHLAEEVWLYHPENLTSVPFFHTSYKLPDIWNRPEVVDIINAALQVKRKLNKTVNTNTWELAVSITAGAGEYSLLSSLQRKTRSSSSELCDILQVSSVTLIENRECVETQLNVEPTGKSLCQRCRRHPEPQPEETCMRCSKVLGGITS